MVVIDLVMACCHFYGEKGCDLVVLRPQRRNVTHQYKQVDYKIVE